MGYSEFLLGLPNARKPTLSEAINNLQDASSLFVSGYTNRDIDQAERATVVAMRAFDFIVGEIMRCRDQQKENGSYPNSYFEAAMNSLTGKMVAPVTRAEHQAVVTAGPGNGRLPSNLTPSIDISAEKVLNKIKHKHPGFANFRIQNGRHIFIICPDKPSGGGPDSVVEFDVQDFCKQCRKIAAVM